MVNGQDYKQCNVINLLVVVTALPIFLGHMNRKNKE